MVFSGVWFLAFRQNISALSFLHFRPTGFDPTDQTFLGLGPSAETRVPKFYQALFPIFIRYWLFRALVSVLRASPFLGDPDPTGITLHQIDNLQACKASGLLQHFGHYSLSEQNVPDLILPIWFWYRPDHSVPVFLQISVDRSKVLHSDIRPIGCKTFLLKNFNSLLTHCQSI